jgi:glycosyltransferase involved in cell wall biosynthesis
MVSTIAKPNILMVTARYFPYMGGIETHVYEVGRRLAKKGVGVTILTTVPHTLASTPSFPKEEFIDGVRIIRVRAWPAQRDYYFAPEMYSLIKRGDWDLVHCQGCHTFVPPMAMLAAQAAKIPYILTFHTGGHSSNFRNKIRNMQWRMLHPLMAGASKLIGVSHFEANYFRNLLHIPAEQFIVVSNGSTLPNVTQLSAKKTDQTLIISIGRLERYKGHQHLITALPKIREWRPDARLLILGSGPYEAALRDLIQINGVSEYVDIRAIPPGDRQAMAEMLSQAALVALLSEYEAHPVAIMEALALRRPVLVAATSGLRELAEQGFVRAVSLDSSPEEIALAARQQIEEPIVPAADLVLPSWDDCADQLQTIYDVLLGGYYSGGSQCAS